MENLKQKVIELKYLADEMLEALNKPTEEKVPPKNLPECWEEVSEQLKQEYTNARVVADIAPAIQALSDLYTLRQAYWDAANWEPDWATQMQIKYCIGFCADNPVVESYYIMSSFLAFPTVEQANHFLKHHRELIEAAQPFL